MRYLVIIGIILVSGCAATGENWVADKDTGELELVQRVVIRGWGSKGAAFNDTSNINREESISDIIPDNIGVTQ